MIAMVHTLSRLLTHVMSAKRDLKRVYYTSRNEEAKLDAKELVAATITLQKLLEDLIAKRRRVKVSKKVIEYRKAELILRRWLIGFTKRVKDFISKSKKLEQQHLRKYQQTFLSFINGISEELAKPILYLAPSNPRKIYRFFVIDENTLYSYELNPKDEMFA